MTLDCRPDWSSLNSSYGHSRSDLYDDMVSAIPLNLNHMKVHWILLLIHFDIYLYTGTLFYSPNSESTTGRYIIPCARPVIVVRNDIRKKKIFQAIEITSQNLSAKKYDDFQDACIFNLFLYNLHVSPVKGYYSW